MSTPSANPARIPRSDLDRLRTDTFSGTPLAVLGWPIAHSLSPQMHNAALAALAAAEPSFASWHYGRFAIPPAELPEALALLRDRGFRGVNLTVPHKITAVDLIADIDPAARSAGAVNTLLSTASGWRGFNTDGYGLNTAIKEAFGAGLAGRTILLLGAGGAARGAAVECLAQHCARLILANRSAASLDALLTLLRPRSIGIPLSACALNEAAGNVPSGALVINATSLGLNPDDPTPLPLAHFPRPAAVYDMIYHPAQTGFLREATAAGIPAANGLGMLVHQGAKALEIWTGVPAAKTAPSMAAALSK